MKTLGKSPRKTVLITGTSTGLGRTAAKFFAAHDWNVVAIMRHPTEGLSLYCFSKFSLEGFPAALSYELLGQGIVVKIVEPGGVTSTSFGKRSGAEAQGVTTLPSDEKFVRIRRKFSPDSVHRAPRPKRMWPK